MDNRRTAIFILLLAIAHSSQLYLRYQNLAPHIKLHAVDPSHCPDWTQDKTCVLVGNVTVKANKFQAPLLGQQRLLFSNSFNATHIGDQLSSSGWRNCLGSSCNQRNTIYFSNSASAISYSGDNLIVPPHYDFLLRVEDLSSGIAVSVLSYDYLMEILVVKIRMNTYLTLDNA